MSSYTGSETLVRKISLESHLQTVLWLHVDLDHAKDFIFNACRMHYHVHSWPAEVHI